MTGARRAQIYVNRWFANFARRESITDATLVAAIDQAERGLVDTDLDGCLIKLRVARPGGGESGGYRMVVFFRHAERAVFAFGFAKSTKANLDTDEPSTFKKAAKIVFALSETQMRKRSAQDD